MSIRNFNDFAVGIGMWLTHKGNDGIIISYEELAKIINQEEIIKDRAIITGVLNLFDYEVAWNDIRLTMTIFKVHGTQPVMEMNAEDVKNAYTELCKVLGIDTK